MARPFKKENFAELYYVRFRKGYSKNSLVENQFKEDFQKVLASEQFKKILSNPKGFLLSEKRTTFLLVFGLKVKIS